MPSSATIFLNGRFVAEDEATISIFDRGYLFGDGLFETLRSYGGRLFRARAHLDRFVAGAARLAIALPLDSDDLGARLSETVERFGARDANVRLTVSRGVGATGGISFLGAETPTLSIVARPLVRYPDEAYGCGIAAGTAMTRKIPDACLPSELKTANYLSNVLARRELDQRGMLEGVMLSTEGRVVAGTVSNVFVVAAGRLITPDAASGARPGVTREAILAVARTLRVPCDERAIEHAELLAASELFFANTIMECLPVASFDGRPLGEAPGPITRALAMGLRELIDRETGISDRGR